VISPRVEVLRASRGEHGGYRAQAVDDLVVRHDFSACINAFGPADVVVRAMHGAPFSEYPDPCSVAARTAASRAWSTPIDQIVFGAGAVELIQAVCFAFIHLNDDVLIAAPAFGEYARASTLCGAAVVAAPLSGAGSDARHFIERIGRVRPRLVFVAAPISPTGGALERDLLRDIADACLAVGSVLVLDQSYDAFAARPIGFPAMAGHDAVVHLRSLTKEHAIAGVRVGFAIAPPAIAEWIDVVRVPWSASTAAQAAAVAALSDDALRHAAVTTTALRLERARIAVACRHAGLTTSDSSTHYLVVDVGSAPRARARLLERGILVRDCTSFGLPRCIRVAARKPDANDDLIAALESLTTSLPSR
jgi:histidinol-phosphate/aromatic aminotransferase/cobyric acid decarboxylase-like protein